MLAQSPSCPAQGAAFGVSRSYLPWGPLCHSLRSPHVGIRGKRHQPSLSQTDQGSQPLLAGSPRRVAGQLACPAPVIFLRPVAGIQNPVLKEPAPHGSSLGESPEAPSLLMKGLDWHLWGLSSLGRQKTLFQKHSRKRSVLSQCAPEISTPPSAILSGPAPASPGARAQAPLWKKSHASKPLDFELQMLFAKMIQGTQFFLPTPWSREVFLVCDSVPHFHNPSLSLSFVCLSTEGVPSPLRQCCFFSPSSYPHTLYLPHCLPPTTEILLPLCTSVSWVFQVV